jgi:hypothetical protein
MDLPISPLAMSPIRTKVPISTFRIEIVIVFPLAAQAADKPEAMKRPTRRPICGLFSGVVRAQKLLLLSKVAVGGFRCINENSEI